jgi:IS4 transposase
MEPGDGGKPLLSLDEVFELLASRRRRYALYYLRGRQEPVHRDEMTRRVAAWEAGVPPDDVSDAAATRVATSLHHVHLPRLREEGLVEYDPRHGDVVSAEQFGRVEPYLDLAADEERPDG